MPEREHDAVCAWATCDNVMRDYANICGLNFDNYVLHDGKKMRVDIGNGINSGNTIDIKLKGMISYDKLKLIQDMIRGTDIVFEKVPNKKKLDINKKTEPVKKTVFNTAMADALAKLKRGGE